MIEKTHRVKPKQPRPDFPLTPHSSGKWAKKIRGKIYYFGRWNDPDGAEREFDLVKHDLRAGLSIAPIVNPNTLSLDEFFSMFLKKRAARVDAGLLDPRSYQDYVNALSDFAKAVGANRAATSLRPDDFAKARKLRAVKLGPYAINRYIQNVKAAFRFGINNGLIDKPPVYGDEFRNDPKSLKLKSMQAKAAIHGKKLFGPAEIRALLAKADPRLRAMIMLGLNAGFLATDVASLSIGAIDFKAAWMEFPRQKTGVIRATPLWPKTVKALRAVLETRTKPRDNSDSDIIFITQQGNRWVRNHVTRDAGQITKVTRTDSVNQEFTKLLKSVKLAGKPIYRHGVNFSALRTTFRTLADDCADTNAVNLIMGHAFSGMAEWYVRDVARARLKKVVNHVRKKLNL